MSSEAPRTAQLYRVFGVCPIPAGGGRRGMRLCNYVLVLSIAATQLAGAGVSGQQVASASSKEGDWLLDTKSGCRLWDWHPDPKDRAVWTGACPGGKKQGRGVVQWYEHGQPIDRFEGTYRSGKREGFGRYQWTAETRFEGHYAND